MAMTRSRIWQRLPALMGNPLLSGYARVIADPIPALAVARATVAPSGRWLSAPVDPTYGDRATASMSGHFSVPAAVPPRRRGHSFDCE